MYSVILKYSAMFTHILALCTIAAYRSQGLVAFNIPYISSISYSGVGSSFAAASGSSNSYSGIGTSYVSNSGLAAGSSGSQSALSPVTNVQPVFPPVSDPKAEIFAHSLTQLLLASPILNAAGNFVITDSDAMCDKIKKIILGRDNVLDPSFAESVADADKDLGVISKDLYYNTITHMLAKVLSLNNVLTPQSIVTYPRIVLSFIESFGDKNGISDASSVEDAVANGVLDFATSFGLYNIPNLTLAFQLFGQELKALASGAEI